MKYKYTISKENQTKLKKRIDDDETIEERFPLPKYTPGILNAVNRSGNATQPKYVGPMKEIVPEFIDSYYEKNGKFPGWEDWADYYLKNHKDYYDTGFERFKEYLEKSIEAMKKIIEDPNIAENWFNKFIFYQNFQGFQYETIIFKYLQDISKKESYTLRPSTKDEESKNIDIVLIKDDKEYYINVKPKTTYKMMEGINHIDLSNVSVLLYEMKNDNIELEFVRNEYLDKMLKDIK